MHHLPTLITELKRRYFPELLSLNTPGEYSPIYQQVVGIRKEGRLDCIIAEDSLKDASLDILIGGLAYALTKIALARQSEKRTFTQRMLAKLKKTPENKNLHYGKSIEEVIEEKGLSKEFDAFLKYDFSKNRAG